MHTHTCNCSKVSGMTMQTYLYRPCIISNHDLQKEISIVLRTHTHYVHEILLQDMHYYFKGSTFTYCFLTLQLRSARMLMHVGKLDGRVWICDHKQLALNQDSKTDPYPLPIANYTPTSVIQTPFCA